MLDAGCGIGEFFVPLQRRGARIIGVDNSAAMLGKARRRQPDGWSRPWLGVGNLQALPVARASVDRVVANFVLFHVPDVAQALREIRRVLTPGGRAVLTTNASDNQTVLVELHRRASRAAGYAPRLTQALRFTELDQPPVSSLFPNVQLDVWDDAFLFPTVEDALDYYKTAAIDWISDRPSDNSHRPAIAGHMTDLVRRAIDGHGLLRVPKTAIRFSVKV